MSTLLPFDGLSIGLRATFLHLSQKSGTGGSGVGRSNIQTGVK